MNKVGLAELFYLSTFLSASVLSDPLQIGQNAITDFKHRYNTTKEVDLVFVLDRSGSVPRHGWISMINFVKDLLEHFTVDKDNTRVAIVTFSTEATVDLNDLEPGPFTDLESKCSLNWRIQNQIERKIQYGYTATNAALGKAYDVLLNSRPNSKKAVMVLTDGRSNIGDPPVKMAFEILSLKWNQSWNESLLGPQVEIYGFGVENASLPELDSIASSLPNHTFLIPDFEKFEQFARRLHGDKQEDQWILDRAEKCESCGTKHAHCMCGSKIGQYVCACNPGYERDSNLCVACRRGWYKDTLSPEPCKKCPAYSTTASFGAKSVDECELLPGYQVCPSLADIDHGAKFYVSGNGVSEVADTGRPCANVTDGNSCHYRCNEGYRLSGSPVMICNRSGDWLGTVPTCSVIDCGTVEDPSPPYALPPKDLIIDYVSNGTTYKSEVQVQCKKGSWSFGATRWRCDKNGRWTRPKNFMCTEVFCKAPPLPRYSGAEPDRCYHSRTPLGESCRFYCGKGFELRGASEKLCIFQEEHGPIWTPNNETICEDIEPPVITCPEDIDVDAPFPGDNGTVVHYDKVSPELTDNSGTYPRYTIEGAPGDNYFHVGNSPLKYEAMDEAGNKASCVQNVNVKGKGALAVSCPPAIVVKASSVHTMVTWEDPVIVTSDNTTVETECKFESGSEFPVGTKDNTCYPKNGEYPETACDFTVSVRAPTCKIPEHILNPRDGALVCGETPTIPYVCRIHCRNDYRLRNMGQLHTITCGWDETWSVQPGENWDCRRTMISRNADLSNNIHVEFDGQCEEMKEVIEEGFRTTIDTILNGDGGSCRTQSGINCRVKDVALYCGHRTKRSASAAQNADQTPINNHRHHKNVRSRRQVAEGGNVTKTHAVIQFTVRVSVNSTEEELEQKYIKNEVHPVLPALDDAYFDLEDRVIEGSLSFSADNQTIEVTQLEMVNAGFDGCEAGSVPGDREDFPSCRVCPSGTFQTGSTCKPCAKDFYQELEGQLQCNICPNGTFTAGVGSLNESDCKDTCAPDTFNGEHGLSPCESCPTGYHQPSEQQTNCIQCENATVSEYCKDALEFVNVTDGNRTAENETGTNITDTCDGFTCYNNGTCEAGADTPVCNCTRGYTGDQCEEDVDECSLSPCANHSICLDLVDDYLCLCPDGYAGKHCEIDVDDCDGDPCVHGTCVDHVARFQCDCQLGYTGDLCDYIIDLCAGVVCENGGQCENAHNSSYCVCADGFYGDHCELSRDVCDSDPCDNGGRCFSRGEMATCKCPLGYTGDYCQQAVSSSFDLVFPYASTEQVVVMDVLDDLSSLTACLWVRTADKNNYGTIFSYAAENNLLGPTAGNDFTLYNYGGLKLFVNEEFVSTNVSITDGVWHHLCVSWSSPSGEWQLYLDSIRTARGHGLAKGTIINGGGVFILGQDQDYVGGGFNARESFIGEVSGLIMVSRELAHEQIEEMSRSCDSHPGDVLSWTETLSGRTEAVRRRKPSMCLDKNECVYKDACGNGEYCVDKVGSYECLACDNLKVCETSPLMVSLTSICSAKGECVFGKFDEQEKCAWKLPPSAGPGSTEDVLCELCPAKFPQQAPHRHSEDDVECHCSQHPCRNGGSCHSGGRLEECICLPGFTGLYCETKLNIPGSCSNDTCLNNGACIELNSGIKCDCGLYWRGDRCQVKYSPSCVNSPCVNNGTCIPGNATMPLYCICDESYGEHLGANCEILSPCESSPCGNHGACIHLGEEEYKCQCNYGYDGGNCDVKITTITTTEIPKKKSTDGPGIIKNNCANVACENGGTCTPQISGFKCTCLLDYTGLYCGIKRRTEVKKYKVGVTLQEKFSKGLMYDKEFKEKFRKQVHQTYLEATKSSKLRVNITSLREGSVYVEFVMTHTTYLDSKSLGAIAMKDILEKELLKGKLGTFEATFDKFYFNETNDGLGVTEWWLVIIIGVLLFIIVAVTTIIIIVLVCRKRRRKRRTPFNNLPKIVQNNIGNPAYNPDSEPVTPTSKVYSDENIYAEPGEYLEPYCVRSSKEDVGADLGQRYPSKRGREINKVWDKSLIRQSIPLPPKPDNIPCERGGSMSLSDDYVPPSRGSPPPRYSQVEADSDSLCSAYADRTLNKGTWKKPPSISPLSEEDEKAGLIEGAAAGGSPAAAFTPADNLGFIDDDYLHPRELKPRQSQYENTNALNSAIEAPLYLALRPDTPPAARREAAAGEQKPEVPEGEPQMREHEGNSQNPGSTGAVYAIEDNGLCTKL